MNRFHKSRGRLRYLRVLLPALLFCVMLLLLLEGLSSVSSAAAREEALEGFYPEDLNYLEEHYGLSYDSKKYVVSYEVIGSNLMPDVTVIPLKERGAGS